MIVILPRDWHDPLGTDTRERRAMLDFQRRFVRIRKAALDIFDSVGYRRLETNAYRPTTGSYAYDLDDERAERITAALLLMVDEILLEGGRYDLWFNDTYVKPAYAQGTALAYSNIASQSVTYAITKPTFEALINSPPYRRRIALIAGRQFEQMQGFATDVAKDKLAGVLVRGMIAGKNPSVIANDIVERTDVDYKRALRIARTEINSALRTARADEAKDAQDRLGLPTKIMHISALSPTTRDEHADRHGKLYEIQEEMDWLATDANSINCKCSMVEVLLRKNGQPYDMQILVRAQRMREEWAARQAAKVEEKLAKKKAR